MTVWAAATNSSSGWTAIILAALGSSAVGAIVGGYLQVRLQSRNAREESWRTRLIDASDDLSRLMTDGFMLSGASLRPWADGEKPARTDGALTEEAATMTHGLYEAAGKVELALSHIELLVGSQTEMYQSAFRAMRSMYTIANLLRERPTTMDLIDDVLGERRERGSRANPNVLFPLLVESVDTPDGFDRDADMNLAQWARATHMIGARCAHDFMVAARTYIEGYRLT